MLSDSLPPSNQWVMVLQFRCAGKQASVLQTLYDILVSIQGTVPPPSFFSTCPYALGYGHIKLPSLCMCLFQPLGASPSTSSPFIPCLLVDLYWSSRPRSKVLYSLRLCLRPAPSSCQQQDHPSLGPHVFVHTHTDHTLTVHCLLNRHWAVSVQGLSQHLSQHRALGGG